MYKLLIVEDEAIIRDGLKDIIDWQSIGFALAGMAKNGREGLELFRKIKPDVVMTDIRMPGMGGLELAAEIKKLSPSARIVLLSGYDEFSYARQGIEIGVFGYILKLNMYEDIEKVFTALKKDLDTQNLRKKKMDSLELFRLQNAAAALMDSGASRHIPSFQRYCVLAGLWRGMLPDKLQYYTSEGFCLAVGSGGVLRILLAQNGDEAKFRETVQSVASQARCALDSTRVCIGTIEADARGALASSQNALKLLDITLANEGRLPLVADCATDMAKFLTAQSPLPFEHLMEQLNLWRFDSFLAGVIQYFDCAVQNRDLRISDARMMAQRLALAISDSVEDTGIETADFKENAVSGLEDELLITVLSDKFVKLVRPVLSRLEKVHLHQAGAAINEAVAYIDKNFSLPISIGEVAGRVHLSIPYFSSCFKRITGLNYSEYLRDKRLDKAKHLLAETDLKIYQISHTVGYGDEKHFSKMFSKYVGCSPLKFKKSAKMK